MYVVIVVLVWRPIYLCSLLCFSSLNQVKIRTLETELSEALGSSKSSSTFVSEPESAALSDSRTTGDGTVVTKKLEEELKKRDALIEVCYALQLCLIVVVYQIFFPIKLWLLFFTSLISNFFMFFAYM
jgi:hypothetical protein